MFEAMTQYIGDFVSISCDLVGLGEPTHREPAFAHVRNELFAQLVDRGFRSIALETGRAAALVVNDFVQGGPGSLDTVMREGFSHAMFGVSEGNRRLVAWMREYNTGRSPKERLAFHGMDAPMEFSAPSPRPYLEFARDFLGLDLDIAGPAGEDERWGRAEAVMDPAESPGDTAGAERLRAIADDMLAALYARAPELIAATSRDDWQRAKIQLTSGIGLLRYHRQAAERIENGLRWSRLSAVRDALMARNLLDIRDIEARRGPTLVFAGNVHLQRNPSHMSMAGLDLTWFGTGAILASLLGTRYAFIAGSLGRSEGLGLAEPDPGTHEGRLQAGAAAWRLEVAGADRSAVSRTDTRPEQGYFPLDQETLDGADAVLHISEAERARQRT